MAEAEGILIDHSWDATMVRLLGGDARYWRCVGHSGLASTDGCGRLFTQGPLVEGRFTWPEVDYAQLPDHMQRHIPKGVDHV